MARITHLGRARRIAIRPGDDRNYLWDTNPFDSPPAPSSHDVAEHQGRVPQPGVPTGPRQTVPASPGSPAADKPVYDPSSGTYEHPVSGRPAPGPRPKPTTPLVSLAGGAASGIAGLVGLSSAVGSPLRGLVKGAYDLPKTAEENVIGNQSLDEILQEGAGLKRTQSGQVTTPAVRQALSGVGGAQRYLRRTALPNLSGLSPAERDVAPYAIRAHKEYPDIPTSVLMALTRQESGFNAGAVSSADAEGLTQFIPGTAASYGVQYGTGPREKQSQETGAAAYLHDLGFASDPQGALSSYSGGYAASVYNNPILEGAADYAALDKPGRPSRAAKARYAQAANVARALGLRVPGARGALHGETFGAGGAQLVSDRTPLREGYEFTGTPEQVTTAGEVIPHKKIFKWLGGDERNLMLNPVFARHLIRAAAQAGEPLDVTSPYRSAQEQAEIDPGTNPKAPPGLSVHQFGGAADIEGVTANQLRELEQEGIEHGYAGGTADPPHTEFTDPRLIRRMTKFGPVRSGYAPSDVPLAEGDLTNWSYTGDYGASIAAPAGGGTYAAGSGGTSVLTGEGAAGATPGGASRRAGISITPLASPFATTGPLLASIADTGQPAPTEEDLLELLAGAGGARRGIYA